MALARAAERAADAGPGCREPNHLAAGRHPGSGSGPAPVRSGLGAVHALPRSAREVVYRRLAGGGSPGGSLLIVGHHPSDLETTMRRPNLPDLFFTAEQVAAGLDPDDWQVLAASRTADARLRRATGHDRRRGDAGHSSQIGATPTRPQARPGLRQHRWRGLRWTRAVRVDHQRILGEHDEVRQVTGGQAALDGFSQEAYRGADRI